MEKKGKLTMQYPNAIREFPCQPDWAGNSPTSLDVLEQNLSETEDDKRGKKKAVISPISR